MRGPPKNGKKKYLKIIDIYRGKITCEKSYKKIYIVNRIRLSIVKNLIHMKYKYNQYMLKQDLK